MALEFTATSAGNLVQLQTKLTTSVWFADLTGKHDARSTVTVVGRGTVTPITVWTRTWIVGQLPADLPSGTYEVELTIHDGLPGSPHTGRASFQHVAVMAPADPASAADLGIVLANPGVQEAGKEVDLQVTTSGFVFKQARHAPSLERSSNASAPKHALTVVGSWDQSTLRVRLPTVAEYAVAPGGEIFVIRLGATGIVGTLTVAPPGVALPDLGVPLISAQSAEFKITVTRFDVVQETYDAALEGDGKRDEVFLLGEAVIYNLAMQTVSPVTEMRSPTMGDTSGFPERERAGTAGNEGGLRSGDSHVPKKGELWRGTLSQPSDVLVLAPFIYEWDKPDSDLPSNTMMIDDLWKDAFRNAAHTLATEVVAQLIQLGVPDLGIVPANSVIDPEDVLGDVLVTVDTNVAVLAPLLINSGFVGPGNRPIGTVGRNNPGDQLYTPQVLVLTYAAAKLLAEKQLPMGKGILRITYRDAEPHMGTGRYDLLLKIEEVPKSQIKQALTGVPQIQRPILAVSRVHANPKGDDVQPETGEYFVLRNLGDTAANVGGWYVIDAAGHRFDLGATRMIPPRGYLRVYTASGTGTPERLYIGGNRPLINNRSPERLTLHDDAGMTISEVTY